MFIIMVMFFIGVALGIIHFIVGILVGSLVKVFKPQANVVMACLKVFTFSGVISYVLLGGLLFFRSCGKYPIPECTLTNGLLGILMPAPMSVGVIIIAGLGGVLAGNGIYLLAKKTP